MKDIQLYETGNGGDFSIQNKDLSLVETLYQQVYICLFGGNIEASTKGNELEGQVREDWWANSLLFKEKPNKQFNSETEAILNNTALNSSGRMDIIRAVENDLKHFKEVANIKVNAFILSVNKIKITVLLQTPDNTEDKILQIIWDSAKLETIIDKSI